MHWCQLKLNPSPPAPLPILLANWKNLTPQPPSLRGKGEHQSPSPRRGGVWGGV
ncbi:hypothetical protein MC7420_5944 [Coleofasciculus chthonoplastes PCC 7420]|uniref:Uncharacterized protein n=1 Tax=Coleofasciculus chthonoplastes PCC 7420 TaxID=118168 RepID=B4W4Z7_9CYAN|nr:hypothetical protein MC7420_5944 [Coleofasciculus chthonoplastes PCC 7420]